MAERGQPLQVQDNNIIAINQALAIIREELDTLQGLRGDQTIHGNLKVTGTVQIDGQLKTGTGTAAS